MKISFDYDDYKFEVRIDRKNPKALETCQEINDFFTHDEDRLEDSMCHLGLESDDNGDYPDNAHYMAGAMALLNRALMSDSDNVIQLTNMFDRGEVEGVPTDLEECGIKILKWEIPDQPSCEDFYCEYRLEDDDEIDDVVNDLMNEDDDDDEFHHDIDDDDDDVY